MSDFERLKHEGRLAETEREIKELRLRLEGLRNSLRHELDPFDPVDGANGEIIASLALEFASRLSALVEALSQAVAIRRALGR